VCLFSHIRLISHTELFLIPTAEVWPWLMEIVRSDAQDVCVSVDGQEAWTVVVRRFTVISRLGNTSQHSVCSAFWMWKFSTTPPLPMAQQTLVGQGLLIIDVSRSHSDTPHSLRFLWTSDQPDAETSTCQHTTFTRDRHVEQNNGVNQQDDVACTSCR
jgi:hypothetical protein